MPTPLEGTRVVDWTIWQQGPVCSLMLADLGAEVIKVEEPERGDPGRAVTKMSGVDFPGVPNFYLEATNRNKKSITVDLKAPEGAAIVRELVAKSDVFVQNFRHGVAARLGLDYATLRRDNPKLVYASGTGYGARGPDSAEPSFDRLGLARSGIMFAVGEPDMPPQPIYDGVADQMSAVCLAYGILAALIARDRFGVGQEVDASLLGSMMWLQNVSVSARLILGIGVPRMPRAYAANPLWNQYRCSDGRWLALGMMQADRYWPAVCAAIGRPELAADDRFASMRVRAGNAGECIRLLDEAFARRPRDEWIRHLRAAGDVICAPVNSVDDLPDDPQVRANDYVVDVEHPRFGSMAVLGSPVRLSETPARLRSPAPELGQHTDEVLAEVLGYSAARIADLRQRRIV
jgi:crotonobetainyl-CoA:carnitine CoA-transferase CaiB-like acyl-CoA transferase